MAERAKHNYKTSKSASFFVTQPPLIDSFTKASFVGSLWANVRGHDVNSFVIFFDLRDHYNYLST